MRSSRGPAFVDYIQNKEDKIRVQDGSSVCLHKVSAKSVSVATGVRFETVSLEMVNLHEKPLGRVSIFRS